MRYIFMRYPQGKAKAVTFSYDDGVPEDQTLAAIFDKYGVKCTFNFSVPIWDGSYSAAQIQEYFLSKGHEIAIHGAHHRANGSLRPIEGIREVLDCRLALEEKCGQIIRGMAYPDTGISLICNGTSYEKIKNYLQELDIAYARALGADNTSFMLPEDFHAWMPTAHHKSPKIMEYVEQFLNIDTSIKDYRARRVPRLLYIWGHSYEFRVDNNWDLMESICQKLAGNDEIWFATNMEIYNYVQAYQRLQYSADGHMVYNPTLLTVWMDVDGKLVEIPSGATVHIT